MEGTHRELSSRLADGLCRDDSGRLAQFDQTSRSQVAAVAHHADSAFGLASQHRTNLHPLDTSSLDRAGELLGNFLVDIYDHVAVVVFVLFQRYTAHDSVAQRLDNLARFHDTFHVDSIHRAAIVFADDYVLRHVNQTPRQIP